MGCGQVVVAHDEALVARVCGKGLGSLGSSVSTGSGVCFMAPMRVAPCLNVRGPFCRHGDRPPPFAQEWGFSWASQVVLVVKNPPAKAGDVKSLIPGSGRSPGGGHGNPLQYSCLKNPMDRAAWWAIVHGVTKSPTRQKWLSTHARVSLGCEIFSVKTREFPTNWDGWSPYLPLIWLTRSCD